MSQSSVASASADELRARLNRLRADKLLLTSQLSSLRALPDLTPDPRSPLHVQNEELGRQLRSLEEKAILYRSSAWTCFELDLDIGRRARLARDAASAEKDGDLALGIRLDTFWRGRFYEPYYLVFARPSQLLDSTPQLVGTTAHDVGENSLSDGLKLIRHTVPHFVPLEKLVEKYLPSVIGGEVSGGAGSKGRDNEAGGLTMLTQFSDLPGVHAFLSDLHCHLQAYVSRRQQAVSLQQLDLPGKSADVESAALEALGTEAFDLVKITWPIPSADNQQPEDEDTTEEATNPTAAALKAATKRKRENPDDEPTLHLEVVVQYDDLQADRLVDETLPTGIFASTTSSSDELPEAEPVVQGLRKAYGQVRVQLLEFAPELETRQRRTPGISKADLKALRPEVTRREDLEQMYAQDHEGESLDMDEAFLRIAQRVWAQKRRKEASNILHEDTSDILSSAVSDIHWSPLERRRIRSLLHPQIDPRLYRTRTPNFRQLAAAYPTTFGNFVTNDGGYEAKIDFHNAAAVRCLAQALLFHDFGIQATFSPSNLCPMLPNRLAYIALVYELLHWSLPTWRLVRYVQTRQKQKQKQKQKDRVENEVRGLDVGTGASAIYPVLGVRCFQSWQMVGTDIDRDSLAFASENIVDHTSNASKISERIALLHVKEDDPFILDGTSTRYDQVGGKLDPRQSEGVDFHFTMCNPPFYTSFEEMEQSAQFKRQPANAVCHGSASEMVTEGGEVKFVQRMVHESVTTSKKVLWWTCMLGKLSSVVHLSGELKLLSEGGKVGGWGVHELPTGGGRTKRWVLMWTTTKLRICDRLSREGLPSTMDKHRPAPLERKSKVMRLGPAWTRKELLEVATEVLSSLDGCDIYASAYEMLPTAAAQSPGEERAGNQEGKHAMKQDAGTLDVVVTQESWTRKARRAKLHPPPQTAASERHDESDAPSEPLLMARVSVVEGQTQETGLIIKIAWLYGADRVRFESFAMFLISAIERKVNSSTGVV